MSVASVFKLGEIRSTTMPDVRGFQKIQVGSYPYYGASIPDAPLELRVKGSYDEGKYQALHQPGYFESVETVHRADLIRDEVVDDPGVQRIATLLAQSPSLIILHLKVHSLTAEGIDQIAEAFCKHEKLEELHIDAYINHSPNVMENYQKCAEIIHPLLTRSYTTTLDVNSGFNEDVDCDRNRAVAVKVIFSRSYQVSTLAIRLFGCGYLGATQIATELADQVSSLSLRIEMICSVNIDEVTENLAILLGQKTSLTLLDITSDYEGRPLFSDTRSAKLVLAFLKNKSLKILRFTPEMSCGRALEDALLQNLLLTQCSLLPYRRETCQEMDEHTQSNVNRNITLFELCLNAFQGEI